MSDEVLTVERVTDLLKLAEKTVYSMAQRGELSAFRVRGRWHIRRTDFEAWIDTQSKGSTLTVGNDEGEGD